jgi:diguanylate cyclase (GGDEF)-like protein
VKQAPSILVVDDEQANMTALVELLKQGGYAVNTASDGFKALAACKVRLPDLILLDLYMPLMSGADVLNRLRAEEKTKYIPVILTKRKDEPDPPASSTQALLEDAPMLTKPVEGHQVVTLIKTILREKFLRDELRKKDGQLKELALVDTLTSFRNGRFLMEFLKTELPQCQRYQTPLSLLLIEPDQYREVQKSHGMKGADSIILQLAVVLSRQNRRSDLIARSAPTEFIMVLTHTDKNGAIEVAERLRNTVQQSTFTVGENAIRLTVSIGISHFAPPMDTEGATLLSHARAATAQGRSNGGNVTLIAE